MAETTPNSLPATIFGEEMTTDETAQLGTNNVSAEAGAGEQDTGQTDRGEQQQDGGGKAAAGEEKGGARDKGHRVPLAELMEERNARRTLEQQVAEMRGALQQIGQAMGPAKGQQQDIPDFNADPAGHLMAQFNGLRQQFDELRAFRQHVEQQSQITGAVTQISNTAAALEREFAASVPDYNEASTYLQQARARELAAMIPDPVMRQQVIAAEPLQLAQMAIQGGRNPAELVYELAKARGYQPKAARDASQAAAEAAKIAQRAEGQRHAQTLGAAGAMPQVPKGIKAALDMSDSEFGNMSDDDFARLAGGM